jgi:hypothetical protein
MTGPNHFRLVGQKNVSVGQKNVSCRGYVLRSNKQGFTWQESLYAKEAQLFK